MYSYCKLTNMHVGCAAVVMYEINFHICLTIAIVFISISKPISVKMKGRIVRHHSTVPVSIIPQLRTPSNVCHILNNIIFSMDMLYFIFNNSKLNKVCNWFQKGCSDRKHQKYYVCITKYRWRNILPQYWHIRIY